MCAHSQLGMKQLAPTICYSAQNVYMLYVCFPYLAGLFFQYNPQLDMPTKM